MSNNKKDTYICVIFFSLVLSFLFPLETEVYIINHTYLYKGVYVNKCKMGKETTTITLSPGLRESAKKKGLNISEEVERALKLKLYGSKENLPEEKMIIKCDICRKEINEGYLCRETRGVWCKDCGRNLDIQKVCYPLHAPGESRLDKMHEHIFWRGNNFERPIGKGEFIGVNEKFTQVTKDGSEYLDNEAR